MCAVTLVTIAAGGALLLKAKAQASDAPLVITSPADASTITSTTPTFTGTGPAGKQFYLVVDGTNKGAVTIDGSGNWTYAPGTLALGSHSIKGVLVDGIGQVAEYDGGYNAYGTINLNDGTRTVFGAGLAKPQYAAVDDTDHRLFFDDGSMTIKVYDTQTYAQTGTISEYPSTPYPVSQTAPMYYDSGRGKLYIFTPYEVLTVDPATLAITKRVSQAQTSVCSLAASPVSPAIYSSCGGQLYKYDRTAETMSAVAGITSVCRMHFNADGSVLYYQPCSDTNGVVRTLDPSTDTVGIVFSTQANDFVNDASGNLYTISASGVFKKFDPAGNLLSTINGAVLRDLSSAAVWSRAERSLDSTAACTCC